MSDNKDTRKMLLEDFWEDVDLDLRDEGSFDKEEVERAHKSGLERTQHDYKYYIIINTVWQKCYEKNRRTIIIGRVRQRIESILTGSHLFKGFDFESLFIKSDTNRDKLPDPVTFYEENMPEIFDGMSVLRNDHSYFVAQNSSYYNVRLKFKFLITDMRYMSKERFAESIRIMMRKMRWIYPRCIDSANIGFFYNNLEEDERDEKVIPSKSYNAHDLSTNYPYLLDVIDKLYHKFFDEPDDKELTDRYAEKVYLRNLYEENQIKPIAKTAVTKAKDYGLSVRLCKTHMPPVEVFGHNRDETQTWASFVLTTAGDKKSVDVTDIEQWIVDWLITKFDHDYVDCGNICFAFRCDCKVTNNHEAEIAAEWKKNHSWGRMERKDKVYIYNEGTRREVRTEDCDTFDRRYIWRARCGNMKGQYRGNFAILLGDKNGKLTKTNEKFPVPLNEWNDMIQEMASPDSSLWKK